MSIIKVEGKAECCINTDVVELDISFNSKDESKEKAINSALRDSENFLRKVKSSGFDMNNISIDSEKLSFTDKESVRTYECKCNLKMKFRADMKVTHKFIKLLQFMDNEITYYMNFSISDKEKVHKELVLKAIADSREKAELIASALNMKITGIEKVETENNRYGNLVKSVCVQSWDSIDDTLLSGYDVENTDTLDRLNTPVRDETEKVYVIWRVE